MKVKRTAVTLLLLGMTLALAAGCEDREERDVTPSPQPAPRNLTKPVDRERERCLAKSTGRWNPQTRTCNQSTSPRG